MGVLPFSKNVYNERHLKLYSTRSAYMHATSSLHQRRSCLELAAPHRETVSSTLRGDTHLRGDPFHMTCMLPQCNVVSVLMTSRSKAKVQQFSCSFEHTMPSGYTGKSGIAVRLHWWSSCVARHRLTYTAA